MLKIQRRRMSLQPRKHGLRFPLRRKHSSYTAGIKISPQDSHTGPALSGVTIHRSLKDKSGIVSLAVCPVRSEVAFTIDSREVGEVGLWDYSANIPQLRFVGDFFRPASDISFAADGKYLALAGFDNTVRLMAPNHTAGLIYMCEGHTQPVRSIHFSPKTKWLASGSDDTNIKIWCRHSLKVDINITQPHKDSVLCVRFSPTGRLLLSCGADSLVALHDLRMSKIVKCFSKTSGHAKSLAFHPDSNQFAASLTDNCVKLYDIRTFKMLQSYNFHHNSVLGLNFHPKGRFLQTCSGDGTLSFVDLMKGQHSVVLQAHQGAATCSSFTPCGQYCISGGADKQVVAWKVSFEELETGSSTLDPSLQQKMVLALDRTSQRSAELGKASEHRQTETGFNPLPCYSIKEYYRMNPPNRESNTNSPVPSSPSLSDDSTNTRDPDQ